MNALPLPEAFTDDELAAGHTYAIRDVPDEGRNSPQIGVAVLASGVQESREFLAISIGIRVKGEVRVDRAQTDQYRRRCRWHPR
jgi:hypothetical protein